MARLNEIYVDFFFQNMKQHFVNYQINTLEHKLYNLFLSVAARFRFISHGLSTIDDTVSIVPSLCCATDEPNGL